MLERSLSKGVKPDQIVLFPNWVDVDLVKPQPDDAPNYFRRELDLEGKIVFLYSGNMGNKQGLELLPMMANLLQDLDDVHFVLCGEGAFRSRIEEMCMNLPNVTLLPLQPLAALNDLLNCADVHLLPQRADAADLVMPSKLTGMLSSGRPTLATADPETQVGGVVAGGADGRSPCGVVVPAGDLIAATNAVRLLAADPELRQRLGANARRYAVENLGREQVLEQFERDLKASVLEHRGRPFDKPISPFRFALVNRRRRRRQPAPPVPIR